MVLRCVSSSPVESHCVLVTGDDGGPRGIGWDPMLGQSWDGSEEQGELRRSTAVPAFMTNNWTSDRFR
jgi:hypothetical protein